MFLYLAIQFKIVRVEVYSNIKSFRQTLEENEREERGTKIGDRLLRFATTTTTNVAAIAGVGSVATALSCDLWSCRGLI